MQCINHDEFLQAMYCSALCRSRAFNLYHRVECKILRFRDVRENLEEDDYMALRMLLIGTEQGANLKTLMKKLTTEYIFAEKIDPTNKPFANDYLSALKLRRTFFKPLYKLNHTKIVPVARTIMALQSVNYFEDDPDQQNAVEQPVEKNCKLKVIIFLLFCA